MLDYTVTDSKNNHILTSQATFPLNSHKKISHINDFNNSKGLQVVFKKTGV
jgi:hypothetical protein